jgi:hypothetical protein
VHWVAAVLASRRLCFSIKHTNIDTMHFMSIFSSNTQKVLN